ncbi:MAG: GNAT family N-acetyltransferase [Bdellovibrionaceae bacterium]|nr:GNAT family N-acetyltransferase [Pseudobdellovibrionaceae bacterium]
MSISIVEFCPELRSYFKTINVEWLEDMFRVEAVDVDVLDNPEKHILSNGGVILFATHPELGVIGTCALQQSAPGEYELIKMGVLKKARGLQAGNILLEKAIEKVKTLNPKRFYLMTNKKCASAVHLYEKFGFKHSEEILNTLGTKYDRCDVAMEYPL